tara:strand:- start:1 stop:567 length:567 start_codon:yes stop_codon:yes gene_type:complete
MKIKLTEKQYQKLLNEMRFDGKSTGLFGSEELEESEESKPINEFGEKFKSYANDKKEDVRKFWKTLVKVAKREKKETAEAVKILGKLLGGKEKPTKNEIKFLKSQSVDIAKIIGVITLGVVSTAIPVAIEAIIKKSGYDISILPKEQSISDDIDADGKIECDNCDWSWDVKDGGDDLYMCHKCGYDNK